MGAILGIIRADNPLGDFGIYRSVVEIGSGWEALTLGTAARAALSKAGIPEISPTITLTVYIPAEADDETVSRASDVIMAAHPWKIPVIELSETQLLVRN